MRQFIFFTALFSILFLVLETNSTFAEEQDSTGTITISTDKASYFTGDSIIISGEISQKKMPLIAIKVFDPEGLILGAYNVEINETKFSKTIEADIPFYEIPGLYSVTADYGKLKAETEFFIENDSYDENEIQIDDPPEEPTILPQITSLKTDKETYQDNDTIKIDGKVSIVSIPQVTISIFDASGNPTGIYLASVNPDLSFSTSFPAKYKTNFKSEGSYTVTAQYGGPETRQSAAIKFVEKKDNTPTTIPPPVTTPTPGNTPLPNNQPQNSFLFSESDLTLLANWHYLEGSDNDLANFFLELSARNVIDLDMNDGLSKNLLVKWIDKNKEKLDTKIDELFEGKISEKSFVAFVNESLNSYMKKSTPAQIPQNTPIENPPTPKQISDKESQVEESKKKTRPIFIDPKIENQDIVDESITHVSSSVNCKENPYDDVITYYDNLGPALAKLCKYEEAISQYEQTLKVEPKNIHALTNKGSALANLGKYEEAILYYNKALELNSQNVIALNNKGNALANLGKYQEAIAVYNNALQIDPEYDVVIKNKNKVPVLLPIPSSPSESPSDIILISNHEVARQEPQLVVENEKKSNDFVSQLAEALSSIGDSFISLFGGQTNSE